MIDPRPADRNCIPDELKARPQWVVWRFEEAKNRDKPAKVPYTPLAARAVRADSTNPSTWGTYGAAITVCDLCHYDGIGYVLSADDPYVGIDLDNCVEPDGTYKTWAVDIISSLNSYSELSPSQTGVRIFVRGVLPPTGRRKGSVEMYSEARFMTVTGWHVYDTPPTIEARQDELLALHCSVFGSEDNTSTQRNASPPNRAGDLTDDQILTMARKASNGSKFSALWRGDTGGYSSQSEADLALLSILAFYTQSYDQLDRLMRSSELGARSKWSERNDYRHRTINKALSGLSNTFGSHGSSSGAGHAEQPWPHDVPGQDGSTDGPNVDNETGEIAEDLPVIVVSNRPMRDISLDAMNVLTAANDPPVMFVRSAELARVRQDENLRPVIENLSETHLRGRLARIATFQRINSQGNSVHVPPPMEIVRDLLTLGEWKLPPLDAVVEAPTLRPDGSIFDQPGYDAATRLFYMPGADLVMPPVPHEPTGEDVAAALALLQDALGEFPYVDDASWANTLALLITPVIRPIIRGHVPLALIDAPRAGTGKGLLNDAVAVITTGRPANIMTQPKEEEEWRKKITMLLTAGATMITIDNVEFMIASGSLAAALTAQTWTDRMMSTFREIRVPQRATWVATGNNIRLGGDVPRRCYWIRLDSQTSRPWTRTGFKHENLREWVANHRGELLAAILTLARAWFAAGKPAAQTQQIGSFEGWTQTVGGILAFVGVPQFLGNIEQFWEQTDEEASQWEAFLSTWHECFGDFPITITELCDALATGSEALSSLQRPELLASLPDALADALEGDKRKAAGRSFRTRLGKALAKKVDVRYGDFKLQRAAEDGHANIARWRVRKIA